MGSFVRITLAIAFAIVVFAALILLLKLLVAAAVVAVLALGVAALVRFARLGLRGGRRADRVTALTARR